MKIAIVTDMHIGVRGDSKVFADHQEKFFKECFFPYLDKHNIKTVFDLGDTFDRRKFINFVSLKRGKDFYNETEPSDPELLIQKERVKQYAEELFIRQYEDDIVEADDCIGYYCQKQTDEDILILSKDRDLCQLINDRVSYYLIDRKVILTKDNYDKMFDHHHKNSLLVKIISGDSSDDIQGVRGVKEKTLLKYIPEIKEREFTLTEIFSKLELIQQERKSRLKTLDNIINGVTNGVQGDKLYEINRKIMDLNNPLLTEESKEELDLIIESPIDPEGRSNKNLLSMMIEDGIIMAIPGGREGYIEFLRPFLRIIKKEKKEV